ncbi:MAG TPA: PP2C family serine/threonine-protein phosphatase [Streptosporangiaceae bacterium]|nr:PP2C family serine/threonine-protein phosphatase [Streptosporangiaceae bacterium]
MPNWPWSRRLRERTTETPIPEGAPGESAKPWRAIGCSVRGASHVRSGLENQDAIDWFPPDGLGSEIVLAVADGHGSAKSFRSAIGSQIAVAVSLDYGAELLAAAPSLAELSLVKDRLEQEIPHRIVYEWRRRVGQHFAESPFTEAELGRLTERDGASAADLVRRDPYLGYGSTLITVVAMESFLAFWQIGDGDVVTVSADARVSRPLRGDERLIANETTSLCSDDAWRLFRVAIYGTTSPMILVSSDGFANSFADEAGFFQFGSDVLRIVVNEGLDAVNEMLPGWLEEMTRRGSGDDISLGMICRPSELPRSLPDPAGAQETATLPAGALDATLPSDSQRGGEQDDGTAGTRG